MTDIIDKENAVNTAPVNRPAPVKAKKTPKHQLAQSIAVLQAPSPQKRNVNSPRRSNSLPVVPLAQSPEMSGESVRGRKRRRVDIEDSSEQQEQVECPAPTNITTTVSNNEVETEKHQKKRRKIDKVVQPFVNKIVEGTQTLSQLVKNTPLKFGNRKKHRFTVTTISPITEEGEMDVESGQSNNSESPKSESNPFSLPLDTVGRSSGRSDPMIRSARPYPDATPRRSTRTRGLKHSVSLASLPSQRRTALTIVRPPADATPYPAMITPADGWILELGSTDAAPFCVDLESKPAESEKWYSDFFAGKEHQNFIAIDEKLGPVSVSVKKEEDKIRALIRTASGENRISVSTNVLKSNIFRSNSAKQLVKSLDPSLHLKQIREVKESKHEEELKMFEKNEVHTQFKFGVLYCAKGQTDENDMFHNKEGSEEFKEFLSILGDVVQLQGFQGYNGGLDTHKNTTGTHSVYTNFNGFEIMFHVSTMLPYTEGCEQQLERKRHLGNDIVVIVFQEGLGDTYCPTTIRTQFQHILAVVQAEKQSHGPTRFRIQFARKQGVPSFGPSLPSPAVFESGEGLRHFLLTKLINAERAALKAPAFARALARTRSGYLQLYDKQYQ